MRSSLNFHIPGLGGRKKMTQMQRCVGMACDTIDLVFLLEKSSSIVLHQDVSKGLLVVTFSACSESLEVVRGFLGCCPIPPAEMESLQKCTRDILRTACAGNQAYFDVIRKKGCSLYQSCCLCSFVFGSLAVIECLKGKAKIRILAALCYRNHPRKCWLQMQRPMNNWP